MSDEAVEVSFEEYRQWRTFGLPHGKGWKHETKEYIDVIESIERADMRAMESKNGSKI